MNLLWQLSHPSKPVCAVLPGVVMQPVDAIFDAFLREPFSIHYAKTCRSCACSEQLELFQA